jgi:hypothetical protein
VLALCLVAGIAVYLASLLVTDRGILREALQVMHRGL